MRRAIVILVTVFAVMLAYSATPQAKSLNVFDSPTIISTPSGQEDPGDIGLSGDEGDGDDIGSIRGDKRSITGVSGDRGATGAGMVWWIYFMTLFGVGF